MLDIINIHRFFLFLGNPEGELVKKSVELLLFILITYMVVSEYTRSPRRDLKYLIAAFSSLAFWKLASVTALASNIYGSLDNSIYLCYFPAINYFLEIVSLVLLSNAFIFPLVVKEKHSLKDKILFHLNVISILYVLFFTWLILENIYYNPGTEITNFYISFISIIIELILLAYPIYLLLTKTNVHYKYRYSIAVAFLVYLITPLLRLTNLILFQGIDERFFVAEYPFPLLAVILFTRVMYLKLVDKAYLKKQLEHEKILSKMKDQFVSVVSHELRTPLTSISLYASLLNEEKLGEVNKKQKDAVNVIRSETKRLNELVSDILDLSRLEGKHAELKITDFDLHEFCKDKVPYNIAKEKKIRIINKIPRGFSLKVDEAKFTQVMLNLISNAIKYSPPNTSIVLSAEKKEGKKIVHVKDKGYGIPKESLPKIFDKFYQVGDHMTRQQGGSGLGLTIANEIVNLHKGEIKVVSELNKGSTFSVILPDN